MNKLLLLVTIAICFSFTPKKSLTWEQVNASKEVGKEGFKAEFSSQGFWFT